MPSTTGGDVLSDARMIREQLENARTNSKQMKQRIAALESDLESMALDNKEVIDKLIKQHHDELSERDDKVELLSAQLRVCGRQHKHKHTHTHTHTHTHEIWYRKSCNL
jgi:CII-binding regulator of phage lambda lysogenization HflD